MHQLRQYLPLATWLLTLAVAIILFTALGSGQLAAPPVTEPSAWGDWAAARQPVVATVALLRLVVLAMAWYLVGVTTVGAVARVAQLTALVRVADALSIPLVRRILQTSLGLGLATAVIASSAPGIVAAPGGTDTGPAPAMQVLADDPTDPPSMQALADSAPSPGPPLPGMRPVPPDPDITPEATRVQAPTEEAPAPAPAHTVQTGDHLWQIAHDHLAGFGDHPSEAEVAAYWQQLIEANRDRLVDPSNPDLIVPGQEFLLPDVRGGA